MNFNDFIIATLKLTTAGMLAFTLFSLSSEPARKNASSALSWTIFSISLFFTFVFANAITIWNERVLQLMYPEMSTFILLVGPGFYYCATGAKPKSIPLAIFHISPWLLFFIGLIYSSLIEDVTISDMQSLKKNGEPLLNLPLNNFIQEPLHVLLGPISILAYLSAAWVKIDSILIKFAGVCIVLQTVLMNIVFSGIWNSTSFKIILISVNLCLVISLIVFIFSSPEADIEKAIIKRGGQVVDSDFPQIDLIVRNNTRIWEVISTPGLTLEGLVSNTNISAQRWGLYFLKENISFTDFKRIHRVDYAKSLINEGALEQFSVDGLSMKVGYRSRTSFYAAFKEVTGKSLRDYRASHDS